MKLAFYYHTPITCCNTIIRMPSYLGVFIDSLAREVDQLILVLHEARGNEISDCNYSISSENILWINLGIKSPAWHREIFHYKILKKKIAKLSVNIFLVRSPSPLAPYFKRYLRTGNLIFMIVGDYEEGLNSFNFFDLKKLFTIFYLKRFGRKFQAEIVNTPVLVNSGKLFIKYKNIQSDIHQIKTTTLTRNDFQFKEDWGWDRDKPLKILFTGRITPEKGLDFILDACIDVYSSGFKLELHIAGLVVKGQENYINELIERGSRHDFFEIYYHGLKSVGKELSELYRSCHIYTIASVSDFEGFPRTLWEAMANGLPIISTNVGGIPNVLSDKISALFVLPRNSEQIRDSIFELVDNAELRQRLIKTCFFLAEENTLEIQTKKMVDILSKYV